MTTTWTASLMKFPTYSVEIVIHKYLPVLVQATEPTPEEMGYRFRLKVIIDYKEPMPVWNAASECIILLSANETWLADDYKTKDEAEQAVSAIVNYHLISTDEL